ncbi:Hypothetical predicted protein [Pelobates cultripes]|uniref:Uncharacterized protein n=1 Tax=Pelobates cultripes TaxID=61616 RepID=A0AAD1RSQ7_PELCU|nr:Hypothetical predicted protein [Pelobates cultripes]
MAAADQAPGTPPAQSLPTRLTSKLHHEDRIAAAFEHFWAQWRATLAPTQTITTIPRPPTTPPACGPPTRHTAGPKTGTKQQGARRALPSPKARRPCTRRCQSGPRHTQRASILGPTKSIIRRRTHGAYAHPQQNTTATNTQTGFALTARGHPETPTRDTARRAEQPSSHQGNIPATRGTHGGPRSNGGAPSALSTRDTEAPRDFPASTMPLPTTGVG